MSTCTIVGSKGSPCWCWIKSLDYYLTKGSFPLQRRGALVLDNGDNRHEDEVGAIQTLAWDRHLVDILSRTHELMSKAPLRAVIRPYNARWSKSKIRTWRRTRDMAGESGRDMPYTRNPPNQRHTGEVNTVMADS